VDLVLNDDPGATSASTWLFKGKTSRIAMASQPTKITAIPTIQGGNMNGSDAPPASTDQKISESKVI
jgi:hypothetical protein